MDNNSSNVVLRLENVTKQYKNFTAVNNVSFELEKGKIYGFIGQNGAGKTTIIRMIVGVALPTKGNIDIFIDGENKGLYEGRKKIGAIVESPALYTKLTARKNLQIQKSLYGINDPNIEVELMELVGLKGWEDKKVKDFSLGMRQRLAIAMALVNDPQILLLDEPINGLDPMGIVEVRNLIKMLCEKKQITVLISSHILSELHQLATDYIIIDKGNIVKKMSLNELDNQIERFVALQVEDKEAAKNVIENVLHSKRYQIFDNNFIKIYDYVDDVRAVAKAMMDNNVLVVYLNITSESLENYFINLVGGNSNV